MTKPFEDLIAALEPITTPREETGLHLGESKTGREFVNIFTVDNIGPYGIEIEKTKTGFALAANRRLAFKDMHENYDTLEEVVDRVEKLLASPGNTSPAE